MEFILKWLGNPSTAMEWIGQGLAIVGLVAMIVSYLQTKRKNILLGKLAADISKVLHYLCLGAYAGIVPNAVGVLRESVYLNRVKHKWADSALWPAVFIALNIIMGIFTYDTPVDILPIAASVFATLSFWFKSPIVTKAVSLPATSSFLVYDILVGSASILTEAVTLVAIITGLTKDLYNKRKQEA